MFAQPDDERPAGAVSSLNDTERHVPAGTRFGDRHDAGRRLAPLLERFCEVHPVILGMPRGGVPVAAEVARLLDAPLDVAVVRKIGAPQNPEYALGALAEGGVRVLSDESMRAVGLTEPQMGALVERGERELQERVSYYRGERRAVDLTGRTAILIDDGLATGRSARAAVQSLRGRGAARVILAVPVAAAESAGAMGKWADEVVCVEMPQELWAVGYWYEDFSPTTDEEVTALIEEGTTRLARRRSAGR